MKMDGQLENAQVELLNGEPSSAPLGRVFGDIAGSGFIPKIKDTQRWSKLLTDNATQAAKTANYTALLTDEILFVSAAAGGFTLTLPTAASAINKVLTICRTDTVIANVVTVDGNGTETIDGTATFKLKTKNDTIKIVSNGSNWLLLSHTYDQAWQAFTPTSPSWIANATLTGKWRRVGDSLEMDVNVALTGAPTTASLFVSLPTGFLVDTAKLTNTDIGYAPYAGQVIISDAGAERYSGLSAYADDSSIAILKDDGDGTLSAVTQAAPITFANTDAVRIKVSGIPIVDFR